MKEILIQSNNFKNLKRLLNNKETSLDNHPNIPQNILKQENNKRILPINLLKIPINLFNLLKKKQQKIGLRIKIF